MRSGGVYIPHLREWREWRGFSQRELAFRAKTGIATISRIENGSLARFETLGDLADALQVSREELLREQPKERIHGVAS